jgi:hypothetical protein
MRPTLDYAFLAERLHGLFAVAIRKGVTLAPASVSPPRP